MAAREVNTLVDSFSAIVGSSPIYTLSSPCRHGAGVKASFLANCSDLPTYLKYT